MKYMNNIGTGNSKVKVIYAYALRLNNTIIEKEPMLEFIRQYENAYQLKGATVELSNRVCKRRLGTAWPRKRRVKIYRHSVWVVLHELAHIYANSQVDNRLKPHGQEFADEFMRLINFWRKFKKREELDLRIVHKPKLSDKAGFESPKDPILAEMGYVKLDGRWVYDGGSTSRVSGRKVKRAIYIGR